MTRTPLSTVVGGAFWTPGATVVGGTSKKTFDQLIQSLFANNEQGFFYDPNDLSTMFQDAAGTIPVTAVGQPVSVFLDKSKQLKLNKIFEKTSFSNVSELAIGANVTASIENGAIRLTGGGELSASGSYHVSPAEINFLPVGNRYRISFEAKWVSGGSLYAGSGFAEACVIAPVENLGGWKSYYGEATNFALGGAVRPLVFAADAGAVWLVRNAKCEEVRGNHAYQTTSASRPILRDTPRRIDFDAVDDKLITKPPAQLTGCTVIRSVPNVGTQILTNQTIPTPYSDNTDHCGLIVINRALTASETTQITKLFNKAAGV